MTLPADYVARHVELGYARTSHASQGHTVDTALLLIDSPTDRSGVYTPLTRGRHANHAYVAVHENQIGADVLAYAVTREWADQPAITRQAQLAGGRGRRMPGPEQLTRPPGLDRLHPRRAQERASFGLER